jgi:glycogen(starch) synthase
MKILLATDVFPPRCGGSGWSTYYLGRALRARGHQVVVARPRFLPSAPGGHPQVHRVEYEGLPVFELHVPLPRNPLRRAWTREVLAPRLFQRLVADTARTLDADLVHAQHTLSVPAAVDAARQWRATGRRLPVVSTVRDYWPLCVYSTMQIPSARGPVPAEVPCPDCRQLPALLRCLWAAQGAASIKTWPGLLLRQEITAGRRRALAASDAVIAVSGFVAGELARAHAVPAARLHVLPNLVDVAAVARIVAQPPPWQDLGLTPDAPFLLFVGKLEPNKGAQLLPAALHAAGVGRDLPVVLAGDGPLEGWLRQAGAAAGLDLRFAYCSNDDIMRLMARATVLLFPSAWQEPLSRVLLEGCAAGACILALDTGGTSDAITPHSGVLVPDMAAFARELRALLAAAPRRAVLRAGARQQAQDRFDESVVIGQVEALYERVTRNE